jgi:signal peptidase I
MTVGARVANGVRSLRPRGVFWTWLLAVACVAVVGGLVGSVLYLRTFPPAATVMSSSMEPAIDVGDVVILRSLRGPPEIGDVVSFDVGQEAQDKADYPPTVIHRVVEVDLEAETVRTQGDSMSNPDPFTVPFSAIHGEVVLTIPLAGRLLGFFASPFGLLWIGIGLLLLVVLPFYDLHRERTELEEVEVVALEAIEAKIDERERHLIVPEVVVLPDDGDDDVKETLRALVDAVGEYGEHLRSHTEILKAMSEASRDLAAVVADLRDSRALTSPAPAGLPDLFGWLRDLAVDGGGSTTLAQLAEDLGVDEAQVEGAIGRLVADGAIVIESWDGEGLHYRLT